MIRKFLQAIAVAIFVVATLPAGIAIAGDDKPGQPPAPAPSPQPSPEPSPGGTPAPQPVKPLFKSPFGNPGTDVEAQDFAALQAKYDAMMAAKNNLSFLKQCGGTPDEIRAAEKALEAANADFDKDLLLYVRVFGTTLVPDKVFGPKGGPRSREQQADYDAAVAKVMKALKKKPATDKKCVLPKEHSSFLGHLLDHVSVGVDVGRRKDHDDHDDRGDKRDVPKHGDDSPHD